MRDLALILLVGLLIAAAIPAMAKPATTHSYYNPETRTTTVVKKNHRKGVTTITRITYGGYPPPVCHEVQKPIFMEGIMRNYTRVECHQPSLRWAPR